MCKIEGGFGFFPFFFFSSLSLFWELCPCAKYHNIGELQCMYVEQITNLETSMPKSRIFISIPRYSLFSFQKQFLLERF